VDEVGGLARAIQLVSAKAKFGKQDAVSITTYPRKKSFFEQLLGMQESRLAKADPTAMWLVANAPAGTAAWLSGGMLRVIPFSVDLR
ncbi:MAG TPA: hypothetical protein PKJ41_20915, partial [Bryobacteraceae bacterium]|nr:hypothetical protein [Bryobacteraceae bacterium]